MSDSLQPHELQHAGPLFFHHLPEFAQTHVPWVGDATQSSHPLSSRSPPAFSLSQHQGLFRWVSSLHQVAKVLELQHQSFQWIFRVDFLLDWVAWSCSPRDSQESFPTPLIVVGNLELSNCRNYYTYLEQASVANLFLISLIKYTDALEAEALLVRQYFPCLCGLGQTT